MRPDFSDTAIVGYGHVGSALHRIFPGSVIYDPFKPEISGTIDEINDRAVAFVCVPTPAQQDGKCDTSIVEEVVGWLTCTHIVLRSTVPPGTTRFLAEKYHKDIAFWPEFYGEWSYTTPPEWSVEGWPGVIVGGEPKVSHALIERLAARLGPMKTYRQISPELAELAKYMENCWLTMQVCFAWQFRLMSEALSLDYWELREVWALDPRMNKIHTGAWEENRGFGGKCLPKDLLSLIFEARRLGVDASLLEAMDRFNQRLKE